jgi:hypothetical protein
VLTNRPWDEEKKSCARLPSQPRPVALDLEAQTDKNRKASDVSRIGDPIYAGNVHVHAIADVVENPLVAGGLDKEGKPCISRSGLAEGVTDQQLSARVEELKHRYDPLWVEAPEDAGDLLSFLHHRNISHLRAKLLKQYSFRCADAKLYINGSFLHFIKY